MPAAIRLSQLLDQLQMGDPAQAIYVDRLLGRLVAATEREQEQSESSSRYELVPVPGDDEELALARRFAEQAADPADRQRLGLALSRGRAPGAFQDAIYRCKIAHEWFPFREAHFARTAKAWLEEQGIEYVDDLEGTAC